MSDRSETLPSGLIETIRSLDRALTAIEDGYLIFLSELLKTAEADRRCNAVWVFDHVRLNFAYYVTPTAERVHVLIESRPLHDESERDVE